MGTVPRKEVGDDGFKRDEQLLSDSDAERIAKRAAEIVERGFYEEIGKRGIRFILLLFGALILGAVGLGGPAAKIIRWLMTLD